MDAAGVFPHPGRARGWRVLVGLWCVLPVGVLAGLWWGVVGFGVFVAGWLVGLVVGEWVSRPVRPVRVSYLQ